MPFLFFSAVPLSAPGNLMIKYHQLPKYPSSCFTAKITKLNNSAPLQPPPAGPIFDSESETDEEDCVSLSDVWCNFDDLNQVRQVAVKLT